MPDESQKLPGFSPRLRSPRGTVLDCEICFCWNQGYERAVKNREMPPKWKAFSAESWAHVTYLSLKVNPIFLLWVPFGLQKRNIASTFKEEGKSECSDFVSPCTEIVREGLYS